MVDEGWLALVRVARDAGDVSSLLPPGVESLYDAPNLVVVAIRQALYFIGFDELPEEERPPKKIWLDADRMTAHWNEVKINRKNKYEGRGDYQSMPKNELLAEAFPGVKFNRG